jgi:hypothetical protein
LVLLYFFNPIVTSLRGLQQTTERRKVQRALGCSRASLGSLSEAATVFDADLLTGIISELGDHLHPIQSDPQLQELTRTIPLVDGTLLRALPKIVEAVWIDERDVLANVLEAGRLYVLDRGYAKFTLLHTIMLAQSSFVCRVRNNSVFSVTEVRPLEAEARRMGRVRD